MKQWSSMLVVTLLVLSGECASSDYASLDAFIEKSKAKFDLPFGTAVILVKDGKVVFQENYGYSDIASKTKVGNDTLFYVASVTKPLFAMTSLLHQKAQNYNDNTSLRHMIPPLEAEQSDRNSVTIKHLLSHTHNLRNSALTTVTAYTGIHTPDILDKIIASSTHNGDAASDNFEYTNIGYNIVSHWMTETYDKPWQQIMDELLFTPLKMNNTTAYISAAEQMNNDIASPYQIYSTTPSTPLYLRKQDNTMHAAGGVVSTTSDLSKYMIAVMANGVVNGKQVFPSAVVKKSITPITSFPSKKRAFLDNAMAWGWFIGKYNEQTVYSHLGGFAGMHSHISFMPDQQVGVIVLNNEQSVSRAMTKYISHIAYGLLLNKPVSALKIEEMLEDLRVKYTQNISRIAEHQLELSQRPWLLSLKKTEYLGTYQHDLMGDINLSLPPENTFKVGWGNLTALATPHKFKDVLRTELIPGQGWRITFEVNDDGTVVGLVLGSTTFKKRQQTHDQNAIID